MSVTTTFSIAVTGETATATVPSDLRLNSGSVGTYIAEFTYDEGWSGLTLEAVFVSAPPAWPTNPTATKNLIRRSAVLANDGTAALHADVLTVPGNKLWVGLSGLDSDGSIVKNSMLVYVEAVQNGADVDGPGNGDIPATRYDQVMDAVGVILKDIGALSGDQKADVAAVIAGKLQLSPEFANSVDELNESGDTSKLYVLPDGYIYAYYGEGTPSYTNLLPLATDTDGSVFNGKGWIENYRIASGTLKEESGVNLTGFIPMTVGSKLYLSSDLSFAANGGYNAISLYSGSKTYLTQYYSNSTADYTTNDDGTVVFDPSSHSTAQTMAYVRVQAVGLGDSSVITVDEEIKSNSGWQSTGHAFIPADYEDRIVELESNAEDTATAIAELESNAEDTATAIAELESNAEDTATAIAELEVETENLGSRIASLENGETIPDYVIEERDSVVSSLYAKMNLGNVAIIGFSTDQHISKWENMQESTNSAGTIYGLKALESITHRIPFNVVCLGGDHCTGGSVSSIQQEVLTVQQQLSTAACPVVSITGNHDAWQNTTDMTSGDIFKSHFSQEVIKNRGLVNLNTTSTNGYIDDVTVCIRYVFVDSDPHQEYVGDDIRAALATLLDGIPDGYKAVVFSHKPLSSVLGDDFHDGWSMQDILSIYAEKIICCINGHSHLDGYTTSNGILHIQTRAASPTDYNGDADLSAVGTADETAFDVFIVDQNTSKIYAIRYGAGSDREFSY